MYKLFCIVCGEILMIQTFEKIPFLRYKTNDRVKMYSQRSHSHIEVSLGYIESGDTIIEVDGQVYELIAGDIVLIPAETVHICKPVNPETYKFHMFYFDMEWIKLQFPQLSVRFRCLAVPGEKNAAVLMDDLFRTELDRIELEKSISTFLRKLIGQYDLDHQIPAPVEVSMEHVHNMISEMPHNALSVEALAAETGLNSYSFIRKYARLYGLTPHADIVNRRIQRAILLFESDMDLVSIAYDCGFSDQSHFNKQFKLYSGGSPGEFRLAIRSQSHK
jgi:AraC-like DNA-binding protein